MSEGKRLSEQEARRIAEGIHKREPMSHAELDVLAAAYLSLARQFAEAEHVNGLKDQQIGMLENQCEEAEREVEISEQDRERNLAWAEAEERRAERYREALEQIEDGRKMLVAQKIARTALNSPDPVGRPAA